MTLDPFEYDAMMIDRAMHPDTTTPTQTVCEECGEPTWILADAMTSRACKPHYLALYPDLDDFIPLATNPATSADVLTALADLDHNANLRWLAAHLNQQNT